MNSICVIIQTFNEEINIKECIESAYLLTSNVILIDTESTDKTVEIAKKLKVETHSIKYPGYVEPVRAFGIEKAKADWVFILDADERITKELALEIQRKINGDYTHFRVPRKNIFGHKKWLAHGGWSPDYQLRIIKKSAFVQWPSRIHATPEIQGEGGFLEHSMIHDFHPNLDNMVEKTRMYEAVESDLLFKAKKDAGTAIFFRKYFGELFRRLIKNKGYKDGVYGIIESVYQAYSKTITYLYLYEKYKKSSSV